MCRDITKLKTVPEMSFYGMQMLCLPKHGDQKEVRSRYKCSQRGKTLCPFILTLAVFLSFTMDRRKKDER